MPLPAQSVRTDSTALRGTTITARSTTSGIAAYGYCSGISLGDASNYEGLLKGGADGVAVMPFSAAESTATLNVEPGS